MLLIDDNEYEFDFVIICMKFAKREVITMWFV